MHFQTFLLLFISFLPILSHAQPGKQVRIIRPSGIYPYQPSDTASDRADLRQSLESNMAAWMAKNVLNNALLDAWPEGLKGENWNVNRHKLHLYNAYVEAYHKHYTLVNINFGMNQEIEPSLRPRSRDFFMLIENDSLSYDLKAPWLGLPEQSAKTAQPAPVANAVVPTDPNALTGDVVLQRIGKTRVAIRKDLAFFPDFFVARHPTLQAWLSSQFSAAQVDRIGERAQRRNWPPGTRLDENDTHYHLYVAYLVREFRGAPYRGNEEGEELALIFIPREQNLHTVPASMQPETTEGMFMVYRRDALDYDGKTSKSPPRTESSAASDKRHAPAEKSLPPLGADLNKAIQAYVDGFSTLRGAFISKDVFGNQSWEARLRLNQAETVRVVDSALKGTTLDIALGSFTQASQAEQLLTRVLAEVQGASLPCGGLEVFDTDHQVQTGLHYTILRPVNRAGDYEKLRLNARVAPGLRKENGLLTNVFNVSLQISRNR